MTFQVQQHQKGWGIVDTSYLSASHPNGKWLPYAYKTQAQAERVLRKARLHPNELRSVVCYPNPCVSVDIGG